MKGVMSSIMFLVLALALGSGLAADPDKPKPNSTFMATGEVEQHLPEQTVFGTGWFIDGWLQ